MASLNQRQGVLGKRHSAHLLRRTTFLFSPARIADFAGKTAAQAVEELFTLPSYVHPEGPINYEDGVTAWLTAGPYENHPDSDSGRRRSVQLWLYNEMLHDPSIQYKMTYFWHAIYICDLDEDWRLFDRWRLFRHFATGNAKTLAYKVTLDNMMLRYLNNNVNRKGSPNENYAREFLELFTILKGDQVETGNYTNYTEHDIQEAARVLTGFRDTTYDNKDTETGLATGIAQYGNHDAGNKKFSAAFQYKTIQGALSQDDMYREFQEFVDMVFAQPETAKAYVRRFYRYFVSDRITDEIERDVVAPLAQQLQSENYEVENVLKRLLTSVHFFDEDDSDNKDEIIGAKIKSPLDVYFSSVNFFNANQLGVLNANPNHYNGTATNLILRTLEPMGLPEFPLTVEGYPGFFKEPGYSKFWFDQSTIAHRYKLPNSLRDGRAISSTGILPFKTDIVQFFTQNMTNQQYASEVVRQFLEMALPEMPDTSRFSYFLDILLGGLSTINWMNEWNLYVQTGDSSSVKIALTALFEAVCRSPEYQTF
jgi:uncharacterized protein (DUF1800 family)